MAGCKCKCRLMVHGLPFNRDRVQPLSTTLGKTVANGFNSASIKVYLGLLPEFHLLRFFILL